MVNGLEPKEMVLSGHVTRYQVPKVKGGSSLATIGLSENQKANCWF
jgi:hypothetical protein